MMKIWATLCGRMHPMISNEDDGGIGDMMETGIHVFFWGFSSQYFSAPGFGKRKGTV